MTTTREGVSNEIKVGLPIMQKFDVVTCNDLNGGMCTTRLCRLIGMHQQALRAIDQARANATELEIASGCAPSCSAVTI